jgi:hypothetical protein
MIAAIETIEPRLLLSAFTVNTTSDVTNAGDGKTTLREAIVAANAHAGADMINFSPTVFTSGSLHTITLTVGQLTINGALTITGPGVGVLAVDGNDAGRVFVVNPGIKASINGMTITRGHVAPTSRASPAQGGAIWNGGTLTLNNVVVTNSSATGAPGSGVGGGLAGGDAQGGGIYSSGTLTITGGSVISTNVATGGAGVSGSSIAGTSGSAFGGGIFSTGNVTLSGSTVTGNVANSFAPYAGANAGHAAGGGINCGGTLTISGSSITANNADGGSVNHFGFAGAADGGGILAAGATILSNSTISGNHASGGDAGYLGEIGGAATGGGIESTGKTLSISFSTLSGNTSTGGDGPDGQSGPGGNGYGGCAFASAATATTITASAVTNNTAQGGSGDEFLAFGAGGGVYAQASLSIDKTTISGNTAIGGGGGVYYGKGGNGYGGGIRSHGPLVLTNSTVNTNAARGGPGGTGFGGPPAGKTGSGGSAFGGGIYGDGSIRIVNSTIAVNAATGADGQETTNHQQGNTSGGNGTGGGIASPTGMTIADSTISGNVAAGGNGGGNQYYGGTGPHGVGTGGGIAYTHNSVPGKTVLTNTIVSANHINGTALNDISGPINTSASKFNLIGIGGGLTNGVNGNKVGDTHPMLATLGNYGGPTRTMVPLPGSPAIDAGSNALIPSGVTTDQRGFSRISGKSVDIGADEFGNATISGTIFNDTNGDGLHQSSEGTLSGWKVYIDLNHDAKFDAGDPATTSGTNGNYKFTGLTAGSYTLFEIVPSNWRVSAPVGGAFNVSVAAGGSVSGKNFLDTQKAFIGGTVFNDANGNKSQDNGELGLINWRVYIDANKDGILNPGEPNVLSDKNGNWQISNLSAGTYVIRIVQQGGFTTTTPVGGSFTISVGLGSYRAGNLFGEKQM